MPQITAIKAQKRNRQRVNIYVDGEYRFALYRITAAWLQVGQELSEADIEEIQAKDQYEAAYQQALRQLERRDRSREEIVRKLRERSFPEPIIEQVLERLEQVDLVNDSRFAQRWVESRSIFRPRSRRALIAELRQHGLSDDHIQDAIADLDEGAMAYQVGLKYSKRLLDESWPDFRRKLGAFLARRGYDYDVITSQVERIWQEQHPDQDADYDSEYM